EVSAVTPEVPEICVAMFGFALQAELPFQTICASLKKTLRSAIAAGTVNLFQPATRGGTSLRAAAGLPVCWFAGVVGRSVHSTTERSPFAARQVWWAAK